MREYQRQLSNPEPRRLAVTTVLGQMEDEETWEELNNMASISQNKPYHTKALAHFIYGSQQRRSYPKNLWRAVEWRLAKLTLNPHRERLTAFKQATGYAGAVGAVIGVIEMFKGSLDRSSVTIAFGLLFLFPIISYFLSQSWGDIAGRIWIIFNRKNMVIRTAAFIITSLVMGMLTMLFVALENFGWAVGIVLGVVFALNYQIRSSSRLAGWILSALSAGLMVATAFVVKSVIGNEDANSPQLLVSLWATGIFGIIFTRQITIYLVAVQK